MSHDRGCFVCFADKWEYKQCKIHDCPKNKRGKYSSDVSPSADNANKLTLHKSLYHFDYKRKHI